MYQGYNTRSSKKLLPGDDMNKSLTSLLNGPFSEENLNKFIEKMIVDFNDDIIPSKNFGEMFQKYDISTIEKVRDFLLI